MHHVGGYLASQPAISRCSRDRNQNRRGLSEFEYAPSWDVNLNELKDEEDADVVADMMALFKANAANKQKIYDTVKDACKSKESLKKGQNPNLKKDIRRKIQVKRKI
ncbi:hypothetical protein WA026_011807 [Henosepilachna vigintioctopunctata]|uniref:Uncharacterized protein n=1 Tax=Henosepilachna vigintioctopunctata TaxID=420089 RepID=A0AAW1UD40_9CUCU